MTLALIQHYISQHPQSATGVLTCFPLDSQAHLIQSLTIKQNIRLFEHMSPYNASQLLRRLDSDRAFDILKALPITVSRQCLLPLPTAFQQKFLKGLPARLGQSLKFLLKYPVNSVGAIMNPMVHTVRGEMTVRQVMDLLSEEKKIIPERFYVLKEDNSLYGLLQTKDLLFQSDTTLVSTIVEPEKRWIYARKTIKSAADLPEWNLTNVMPVVNSQNVFIGELTHQAIRNALQSVQMIKANTTLAVDMVNAMSELLLELTTLEQLDINE